jgi:hypothetical protein
VFGELTVASIFDLLFIGSPGIGPTNISDWTGYVILDNLILIFRLS